LGLKTSENGEKVYSSDVQAAVNYKINRLTKKKCEKHEKIWPETYPNLHVFVVCGSVDSATLMLMAALQK